MAGGGKEETNEYTPTWVVAVVYTAIVAVSFAVERFLHYVGVELQRKNKKALYEALQKIKEELMLLGFISLLLTVSEDWIIKIRVSPDLIRRMHPCWKKDINGTVHHLSAEGPAAFDDNKDKVPLISVKVVHDLHIFIFTLAVVHVIYCVLTVFIGRLKIRQWKDWEDSIAAGNYAVDRKLPQPRRTHVLMGWLHSFWKQFHGSIYKSDYLTIRHGFIMDKVPLISVKAIHDLHIFIFALAVVHVIYCVLTVFIARVKIRQWKHWEDSIAAANYAVDQRVLQPRSTHVLMGWLHSFWKQFHGSVYKSDYVTIRHGFIMNRQAIPSFNFYENMIDALEDDFKHVVGIRWHFWIFVVIFFLLSVKGWYTYFWMAFIPCLLLLAVGTKLEHVLIQLVHDVAVRHADDGIESQSNIVRLSDNHFWFHQPRFVLFLIHFILFQNSFEIGFFFWIWLKSAYNFDACVMGKLGYIVVTLVIGVSIQVLCSYSTLPLYALVTQMGDHNGERFRKLQQREQELADHPPQ